MGSIKLETTGKKHISKSLDTLVPDINKLLVNLVYKKKVKVTEEQLSRFLNNIKEVADIIVKANKGIKDENIAYSGQENYNNSYI